MRLFGACAKIFLGMDQNSTNPMMGGNVPVGNQNFTNGMAPNDNGAMPKQSFVAANSAAPMTAPQASPQASGAFVGQRPMNPNGFGGAMPAMGAGMSNPVPNIGLVNMNPIAPKKEKQKMHFPLFSVLGLVFACGVAAVAIIMAVQKSMEYRTLEANSNLEIEQAVLVAKDAQRMEDEKTFAEEEKIPFRHFEGLASMGRVEFDYPKNWSVYVDDDGSKGSSFRAFFRPDYVDSINDGSSRYSLIFAITNKRLDDEKKSYDAKVTSGDLTSSLFRMGSNIEGMRYDGKLGENRLGSVVLIKLGNSNKTAFLQTDAQIYKEDFEKVLESLNRAAD